jgi:flagellar motor protein MotB
MRAKKVMKNVKEEEAAARVGYLMEKQGLNQYTSVEVNDRQIKITLNVPVLFGSGEAELAPAAKTTLAGVAKVLAAVPNTVVIEGHTDNQPLGKGKYLSNWELSVARGLAMLTLLTTRFEIPQTQLSVAGYAENRPLVMDGNGIRVPFQPHRVRKLPDRLGDFRYARVTGRIDRVLPAGKKGRFGEADHQPSGFQP